ncbi:hypothetical protein HKX48_004798 [Thoreauomyces humboldtii]|nr:hypothetical protein HKX48_004798 [Thoreauomyces humboldtii]
MSSFTLRRIAPRVLALPRSLVTPLAGRRAASSVANSIYQTDSTASGKGRQGKVVNSEGHLEAQLALPKSMGGPGGAPNPEVLFASGYAACFLGAVHGVAGQLKVHLPKDTKVDAVVDLTKADGNFGLAVQITLTVKGLDQKVADEVVTKAHAMCPYSRAVKGNISATAVAVV